MKRDGTPRAARGFKNRSVIVFILVPQVVLRKRFNVDLVAREWQNEVPALVVQNWSDIKAETR